MKTFLHLLIFVLASLSLGACSSTYKDGDIIFQQSKSEQAKVIRAVQQSEWTHCGVIVLLKGKPYVYEATKTVKCTPLEEWIAKGDSGHYVIKRLKDDSVLTKKVLSKMKSEGLKFNKKKYDILFAWDDSKIYCSELVWKIYSRGAGIDLCKPQKYGDLHLEIPEVKELIKKRGKIIDKEEPIVTPAALYQSSLLRTVTVK